VISLNIALPARESVTILGCANLQGFYSR